MLLFCVIIARIRKECNVFAGRNNLRWNLWRKTDAIEGPAEARDVLREAGGARGLFVSENYSVPGWQRVLKSFNELKKIGGPEMLL